MIKASPFFNFCERLLFKGGGACKTALKPKRFFKNKLYFILPLALFAFQPLSGANTEDFSFDDEPQSSETYEFLDNAGGASAAPEESLLRVKLEGGAGFIFYSSLLLEFQPPITQDKKLKGLIQGGSGGDYRRYER